MHPVGADDDIPLKNRSIFGGNNDATIYIFEFEYLCRSMDFRLIRDVIVENLEYLLPIEEPHWVSKTTSVEAEN